MELLWVIGATFTLGLCFKYVIAEAPLLMAMLLTAVCVIAWPFLLGVVTNCIIDEIFPD